MAAEPSSTENGSEISDWIPPTKKKKSDWMCTIEDELNNCGEIRMESYIYKLPSSLRKVDHDYSPCIVSIGPFHSSTTPRSFPLQASVNRDHTPAEEKDKRQDVFQQILAKKHDHLVAMEKHKWWYMRYLLNRMTLPNAMFLEQCDEAISQETTRTDKDFVRGCYAERVEFKSDELAAMVVVDGCFILELFLRFKFKDFTREDPIFHNSWMVPTLRQDLALLENQIPFYILEKLFGIFVPLMIKKDPNINSIPSITDLALSFFCPYLKENEISEKCSQLGNQQHLHLLDLLHKFYLPTEGEKPSPARDHCITVKCEFKVSCAKKFNADEEPSLGFAKCATELSGAGIEFKKGKEGHLLNISFHSGVLTIPPLHIDETTKSLLKNLIAFEQSFESRKHYIQSYVILVRSLIHSEEDIKLLQREGIITNNLGGVQEVLTFISDISGGVAPREFYFGSQCENVNAYLSWWRRYRAEWKRFFTQNPWGIISIVALILTVLQTVYAVLSYYPR